MPSRPQITRKTVVFLRETKQFTWRKIVKQTGIKERTAKRWYQLWKDEGKISSKTLSGRPKTVRTLENIRKIAKKAKKKEENQSESLLINYKLLEVVLQYIEC